MSYLAVVQIYKRDNLSLVLNNRTNTS